MEVGSKARKEKWRNKNGLSALQYTQHFSGRRFINIYILEMRDLKPVG